MADDLEKRVGGLEQKPKGSEIDIVISYTRTGEDSVTGDRLVRDLPCKAEDLAVVSEFTEANGSHVRVLKPRTRIRQG